MTTCKTSNCSRAGTTRRRFDPMIISSRDEISPFVTADGSHIRELLQSHNSPLRNQSLAEATLSPGQKTARHFHPRAEEIYFVLSGRGALTIESERREVGAGDAIAICAGAAHCIENIGADELRFLCCCAPAYTDEDTVLCP